MSQTFELVNLNASDVSHQEGSKNIIAAGHESSDDGLDPYEFISQDETKRSQVKMKPQSPDETSTILNSDLESNFDYMTKTLSASRLVESLNSRASLSLTDLPHQAHTQESPLVFLQRKNDFLEKKSRSLIARHQAELAAGSNCVLIREEILNLFRMQSENNLQLHEVYNRELDSSNEFLKKLRRWEKKRIGVLNKVQLIKSKNNKFGVKLKDLLTQRDLIDLELDALQKRIEALSSKRTAIESEIGETISVLESKSSKYVSLFKSLEKQGIEVVLRYLQRDSAQQHSVSSLIKMIPVRTDFNNGIDDIIQVSAMPRLQSEGEKRTQNFECQQNDSPLFDKPNDIGMKPYDATTFHDTQQQSNVTGYEAGFLTGAEQVVRVKENLSSFLATVFARPTRDIKHPKNLDDELNLITEMMDLDVILHFLASKSEALTELIAKTTILAHSDHKDSLRWSNLSTFINSQEDKIFEVLEASSQTDQVASILDDSFTHLNEQLKHLDVVDCKKLYSIVLYNETKNIASALYQVTGSHDYLDKVNSFVISENPGTPIDNRYLLESRITFAENNQTQPIVGNSEKTTKQNNFKSSLHGFSPRVSSKALKKE